MLTVTVNSPLVFSAEQTQKSKKPIHLSVSISPVPYFILLQRMIGTILRLKQNSSTLEAFQAMPLAFFYIKNSTTRYHIYGVSEITCFIIKIFFKMATNTNARFRRALVSMDRDIRSGSMAFRLLPNRSAAYPMPSFPIKPLVTSLQPT